MFQHEDRIVDNFTARVRTLVIARDSDHDDFCRNLVRFMAQEAREPRDRIYGLLGLVPLDHQEDFTLHDDDYSTDIAQVHFQLAVDLVRSTNSLKCFVGLTGTSFKSAGIPTWAMEWAAGNENTFCHNYRNHAWIHDHYNASKGTELHMSADRENLTINLHGITVDTVTWTFTIATLGKPDSDHSLHEPLVKLCDALRNEVDSDSQYGHTNSDITNEEAVWRTLLSDFVTDTNGSMPRCRAEESDGVLFRSFLQHGCQDDGWECLCPSLQAYCQGHTFFVTSKGYFGVGSGPTRIGDEVWVLFGGNTPYILRSLPEKSDGHYTLVGECCTHEIIEGVAVAREDERNCGEVVTLH